MNGRYRPLDELFETLPREQAGADFTRNVLDALNRRRSHRLPWRRTALAAALGAAAVLIAISVFWQVRGETRQSQLEQELAEIRAEYQKISEQLEELDKQAQDSSVIYVGSDDQADYVLDLSELKERLGQSTKPAISPAEQGVVGKRSAWPSREAVPATYQGGPI